jgi:hypothetical protein
MDYFRENPDSWHCVAHVSLSFSVVTNWKNHMCQCIQNFWSGMAERERALRKSRSKWENNTKMNLKGIVWTGWGWNSFEYDMEPLGYVKGGESLASWEIVSFSRGILCVELITFLSELFDRCVGNYRICFHSSEDCNITDQNAITRLWNYSVMFVIAKVTFKFYAVQIVNSAEVNNVSRWDHGLCCPLSVDGSISLPGSLSKCVRDP